MSSGDYIGRSDRKETTDRRAPISAVATSLGYVRHLIGTYTILKISASDRSGQPSYTNTPPANLITYPHTCGIPTGDIYQGGFSLLDSSGPVTKQLNPNPSDVRFQKLKCTYRLPFHRPSDETRSHGSRFGSTCTRPTSLPTEQLFCSSIQTASHPDTPTSGNWQPTSDVSQYAKALRPRHTNARSQ